MKNSFYASVLTPGNTTSYILHTHIQPHDLWRKCIWVCSPSCYSRSQTWWHWAHAVTVLIWAVVMLVHCSLTVAGICISLVVSDIEHLFILLVFQLTCLTSSHSVASVWWRSFAHIPNEACFLTVEFWEFFIYSRYFVRYVVYKYFLLPYSLPFDPFNPVFRTAKAWILMKSRVPTFPFMGCALVSRLRTVCLALDPKDFLWVFVCFVFSFKSFIHLESVFQHPHVGDILAGLSLLYRGENPSWSRRCLMDLCRMSPLHFCVPVGDSLCSSVVSWPWGWCEEVARWRVCSGGLTQPLLGAQNDQVICIFRLSGFRVGLGSAWRTGSYMDFVNPQPCSWVFNSDRQPIFLSKRSLNIRAGGLLSGSVG